MEALCSPGTVAQVSQRARLWLAYGCWCHRYERRRCRRGTQWCRRESCSRSNRRQRHDARRRRWMVRWSWRNETAIEDHWRWGGPHRKHGAQAKRQS
jgi:hypothetical protein